MPFPLMLPVYVHDEQSAEAEKLGIDTEIIDADTQDAYFLSIDHMTPYPMEGQGMITAICSGGQMVLSPLPMNEIIKLIS